MVKFEDLIQILNKTEIFYLKTEKNLPINLFQIYQIGAFFLVRPAGFEPAAFSSGG